MKVGDGVRTLARGDYEFTKLDQKGKIIAEYIWVGGNGIDIRSKARTLSIAEAKSIEDIPEWNFDGSSTRQAEGHDSEIWLKPRVIYKDPFRGGNNVLVLCDTWKPDGSPANSNFRQECLDIMEECKHEEPWFSFEQEYCLYRIDQYPSWPLGFPQGGYPLPQGPYYCSVGGDVCFGRQVMEAHYKCCLHAGLAISGTNAEVMPGQWEYQIGPVAGISAADQLWVSRYLLYRVSEHYGVAVTFMSKPMPDWNGSGNHVNYSTASTRGEGGLEAIYGYLDKMKDHHCFFIEVSGYENEKRLTGRHETSSFEKFTYGIADRSASIRIPRLTERAGKGYFEDRRPSANSEPYVYTGVLADFTILEGSKSQSLHDRYLNFLNII